MSSIRGVIERSLLTSITRKEQKRRLRELHAIKNPFKRAAALAIHQIVLQHPEEFGELLDIHPREENAAVVGTGCDSIVYRLKDMVFKVHKESISAPASYLNQIAERKRTHHKLLRASLPQITLHQNTGIAPHPAFDGCTVVVTTQQYQDNTLPVKLFSGTTNAVNEARLEALIQAGLGGQMRQLVDGTDSLLEHGMVPDVIGTGNLLMSQGSLLLVDGLPLRAESKSGLRAQSRIQSLGNALTRLSI